MFVLVLTLIVFSNLVSENAAKVKGYYWRDYNWNKKIPNDAFRVAGGNKYIAQVFVKGRGLLPGTITPRDYTITTTQGEVIETKKNVKILCSVEQDKFKWLKTMQGEVHFLYQNDDKCPLVKGGREEGHVIHIGRSKTPYHDFIGPVFSYLEGYWGLWVPWEEREAYKSSYDILTFDCKDYCTV